MSSHQDIVAYYNAIKWAIEICNLELICNIVEVDRFNMDPELLEYLMQFICITCDPIRFIKFDIVVNIEKSQEEIFSYIDTLYPP